MSVNKSQLPFYTYLHCKPDGMPFYVGKGSNGRGHSKRHSDFINSRNQHHKNTVAKHGKENILVFVFPCESEEQALADEIQQIAQLRNEGYALCNISDGGDSVMSGKKHTPETIAKMSAIRIVKKRPEVFSKTMSLARIGMKFSKEHREKLSQAKIGKPSNKKGVPISDEHKAKISTALKGRVGNRKGVVLSDETRAKMSAGQIRRFSCQ
jgi:hypothetical protein